VRWQACRGRAQTNKADHGLPDKALRDVGWQTAPAKWRQAGSHGQVAVRSSRRQQLLDELRDEQPAPDQWLSPLPVRGLISSKPQAFSRYLDSTRGAPNRQVTAVKPHSTHRGYNGISMNGSSVGLRSLQRCAHTHLAHANSMEALIC
jgi:hypothetical protein